MRAAEVVLTEEQGATLRGWLGAGKTEQRMAFRAEVILAIAEGLSIRHGVASAESEPRLVAPKNRGPDQCAPVIRSAITVSER
jgi:hypothetical protein